MIEREAAKILKEDGCWECSYGTVFGATQCGNTQCNVARATNLATMALEQLALYKEGGLCLVPADIYEKQCKELDELKDRGGGITLKERVIVETYTGVCMTSAEERDEVYKYMAEIMERPVFTHELASKEIQEQLKAKSKDDFIALCRRGQAHRPEV